MRRTPVAAFAAALTVTLAVGLQMPAALADPVTPLPVNNATSAQSGMVFLTQQLNSAANHTYVWYTSSTAVTSPPPAASVIEGNAWSDTTLALASGSAATPLHPNAVGFRTADGYIYGIVTDQSSQYGTLVQIGLVGSTFAMTSLGVPKLLTTGDNLKAIQNSNNTGFDGGTFGSGTTADIMYVMASGGQTLYELDFGNLQPTNCDSALPGIPTKTCLPAVTEVPLISPDPLHPNLEDTADLFYLGGYLFGIYQANCSGGGNPVCDARVYRIDPTTGLVEDFPATTIDKKSKSNHGYGSQWVYPDGTFGFATTANTNETWRCSMSNPAGDGTDLDNPLGIQCSPGVTGPVGSEYFNDGTSNGIASTITVAKAISGASAVAVGDTVTYTLTVTTTSGNATGWVLDDFIPPNSGAVSDLVVTNVVPAPGSGSSSAQCTVAGTTLHCYTVGGPLPVGENVVITYTAKAASFTSCNLVNNVVVKAFAPAPYATDKATATDTGCTPPPPQLDLSVTNQVSKAAAGPFAGATDVYVDDWVYFKVVVKNSTAATVSAPNWSLNDAIPSGLKSLTTPMLSSVYSPIVLSGASCSWDTTTSPSNLSCSGLELPAGADVTITFAAQAASVATIPTVATLPDTLTRASETDPTNESATATVNVAARTIGGTTTTANHTSTTGGSVTPGSAPFAAGTLFVLPAGLGTWLVWSRRRPVTL